jgi:hypothetical protein
MKLTDGVVIDVPAVARDVIRHHGDDAPFHVAQLADAALERGEIELQRTAAARAVPRGRGDTEGAAGGGGALRVATVAQLPW